MLIGLTKVFWDKYFQLADELEQMGITTIEQAEAFDLDESNLRRLRLGFNVMQNPQINLFNREARILQGLPF